MEQLINQVQEARDLLGMARLANPKKQGKAKLEAMLAKLQEELAVEQEERVATTAAIQKLPESTVKEKEEKAKALKKPERTGPTIKETACELLSKVIGKTEEGRTLGMPYIEIIEEIKKVHGDHVNTSVNCLRWYAGKIRILHNGYQQYTLPQIRLRSTTVPAETE